MSLWGLIWIVFSSWFLRVCATGDSDPQAPPPAPDLVWVQDGSPDLVLRCRVPEGHDGRVFNLYKVRTLVESIEPRSPQTEVEFRVLGGAVEQKVFYCCGYDHSVMSPYITITAPPRPLVPSAPPALSVTPPGGRVSAGQMLTFHCQAPPLSPGVSPITFLLQRRGWSDTSEESVKQSPHPRFTVGPVSEREGGAYTCLYRHSLPDGEVKSSAPSPPVSISIAAPPPAPVLRVSTRVEKDGSVLECVGSPAYPGAHFSLYHQGEVSPTLTQQAPMVHDRAHFRAPSRGAFQCQYRVLLGKDWLYSPLSATLNLPCSSESPSCSSSPNDQTPPPSGLNVDMALLCGSISAALLFLLVLFIVSFTVHKHAKAAAVKRRQREQDKFWQQIHSRDHIVDLTLQRVRLSSTDNLGTGRVSVSEPIYDVPFQTFMAPPDK
ncbi:leukocyte immunoglobulin-like receptor subfamily B member 5 [Hoplias malabaricus]|uniref:leukocyte immunoglobulin-like receptor subfamily B member 5 n=1 Tax=Hoplias malabaricus TaxID=27720 RepID=UPI0034630D6B